MDGNRIKLTRQDFPDRKHHYVGLGAVEWLDEHMHLSNTASAA